MGLDIVIIRVIVYKIFKNRYINKVILFWIKLFKD